MIERGRNVPHIHRQVCGQLLPSTVELVVSTAYHLYFLVMRVDRESIDELDCERNEEQQHKGFEA